MNNRDRAHSFHGIVAAVAVCTLWQGAALAAPVTFEAAVVPKADTKLELADGSKRYLVAAQREGKVTGSGPLAGATMVEWGMHDVNPATGAHANGYLVFTAADGDLAYLKYQFRGVPVPMGDGKSRFVANGHWEAVGGTGKLKALRGAGALQFDPKERRFTLAGELVSAD